ncbi:lysozyme [Shewanella vesiculosa]|nr:lysozyme [Shewanella vesiculosa]RPA32103.1 lysozyme [Shewanella vesiculosa]
MVKQRLAAVALSLSALGAAGIVAHEGMRKVAYVDPVGIVTVCAGHTKSAKLGQVKTAAECAELLKQDAADAGKSVKRLVKTPVTQRQYDALVSFVFNVGETSFAKSSLLRKINANDCWGAGKEFSRWTYAGGQQLPGLVKRRADERKEWESGCATGNYKVSYSASNLPAFGGAWAQARRPNPGPLELLAR